MVVQMELIRHSIREMLHGSHTTVTHDIPPKSIAVGSPARVVKQWDEEKKIWKKYEGMINK